METESTIQQEVTGPGHIVSGVAGTGQVQETEQGIVAWAVKTLQQPAEQKNMVTGHRIPCNWTADAGEMPGPAKRAAAREEGPAGKETAGEAA